ncbi:MAG TPA: hypothetical protein VFH37_02060 [Candidatus Saccharimonadales bacterium]|nr:hypothetical protein [Candidatus Saccharimonadales bacterium]
MPKRVITVMVLAVLLGVMTAVTAMAANGSGNPTREASTSTTSTTSAASTTTNSGSRLKAWHWWHRRLRAYIKETRQREMLMGQTRTSVNRSLASSDLASLIRYTIHWKHVAAQVLSKFRHPPLLGDWMCIHRYEGSWSDPNSPYWGGLQMDLAFQNTYGHWLLRHKGTADHWTPMEQIWVALRAYRSRGFSPWPNTARYCGL